MSLKLPVIVIVGRPNVGKSTLFNRLIGRRVAVVEDTPGITRDRLYAEGEYYGKHYQIVDTGGMLFGDDDPLVEQIRIQAEVALAEADAVIFMTDAVDGVSAGDIELADRMRALRKPIVIAPNKADNVKRREMALEFYELGLGEVVPISALNGNGVDDLLDILTRDFPNVEELQEAPDELKLAIVGRPNVGKSSMLNAFTGEKRSIVSNIPGTTRDAIDTVVTFQGRQVRLIDTAGLRRRGKIQGTVEYYMALRATQALERAHCGLVVVDGEEGLTDGDKRTMKLCHDEGRALVIAVNKWDTKEPPDGNVRMMTPEKKEFLNGLRAEMPEVKYAPVTFTSAQEATGLQRLMDHVFQATDAWNFRIPTGPLNRLIQDACFERPYTSKGKFLKIYFATQVSTRPPTILLFCNDPELIHFSYLRYLENRLRKDYPLPGTIIRLVPRARRSEEDD